MLRLDPNKSTVILFRPRSGSTVLAHYLSEALDAENWGEFFNVNLGNTIKETSQHLENLSEFSDFPLDVQICDLEDLQRAELLLRRISVLKESIARGKKLIIRALPFSYCRFCPEISLHLTSLDNVQFINLERQDVFYEIISRIVSKKSNMWHNLTGSPITRPSEKYTVKTSGLLEHLENVIVQRDHIEEYFPNTPTVYYEQFKDSIHSLRKIFTGIPAPLVSIPYSKFEGNHWDWIDNADEVKGIFEKFSKENPKYFPSN